MLNVLSIHTHKEQRDTRNFGGDRYIYCFDCGDSMMGVCVYVQAHQIAYIKYVQFCIYQLYLIKSVKKSFLCLYLLFGRHCEVNTTYSNVTVIRSCPVTSFTWWFLLNSYHSSLPNNIKHPWTKELSFGHFKRNTLKNSKISLQKQGSITDFTLLVWE